MPHVAEQNAVLILRTLEQLKLGSVLEAPRAPTAPVVAFASDAVATPLNIGKMCVVVRPNDISLSLFLYTKTESKKRTACCRGGQALHDEVRC